jgi:hypothetical protein
MEWRGRGVRAYAIWRSNLRKNTLITIVTVPNRKPQPSRNRITPTLMPHHVSRCFVAPFYTTVHSVVRHPVRTDRGRCLTTRSDRLLAYL